MPIIRQYIAPFIAILVFFAALVAVSARIFLPADMAAPAPIEEPIPQKQAAVVNPMFLGLSYSSFRVRWADVRWADTGLLATIGLWTRSG